MIGTYSPELVALSLIVAIAASYVAFALAAHISTTRGWAGAYWLAGGAVALGTGIWSMHFIGMLAFTLPIAMAYSVATSAISLLIAIIVSAFVLFVVSRRRPDNGTLAISAFVMGVGIALMHYTGMAAMHIEPPITYDVPLVVLSVVVAILASALALTFAFRPRSEIKAKAIGQRLIAAMAMGAGICAMHYIGMAAAQFAPDAICSAPGSVVDQHWLALTVAAATFVFLGATMLIITIDVRLAQQLDESNARFIALAREDPLTGLANRRTFLEHLEADIRESGRRRTECAVLFVDLDGFKGVNDTLGHAAGDALLIEVAKRLRASVRRDDLVARFGGDEFAILQRNVRSASDATALAEKVGAAIAAPVITENDEIAVTASIGVAQPTETVTSPADLMVQADLALYRAKAEGRNRHCFHDHALDRRGGARTLLAKELRSAFARGELEVLYKPQVYIATGRICGLEVWVQWNHPSRGTITPRLLVPLAERAGIIRAVANWSIDEACGQLRKWQDNGLAPPPLAVDLFASQFRVAIEIGSDLGYCLAKHRVDARQIELECDEQVFMHAVQRHSGTLEALHEQRFRLAVVDFGAGSSSIACLAKAPINRLKIAPSLVTGVPDDDASASAIRAALRIADEIGAEAIADGVETHAQAAFLLSVGCEQAQGPFFSPPLSAVEVTLLLRDARPEPESAQKSSAA